jgi:hypothetical protein
MVMSNTFRSRVSTGAVITVPNRLNVGAAAGRGIDPGGLADNTATRSATIVFQSAT